MHARSTIWYIQIPSWLSDQEIMKGLRLNTLLGRFLLNILRQNIIR